MNPYVLPPVVAGVVAMVLSAVRVLSVLLFELSADPPSARAMSLYVLGGRFAAFVLVYGLLFGVAYWLGTRHTEPGGDGKLALVTGAVAAFGYLVGTVALRQVVDIEHESWLVDVVAILGPSGSVGVQLAVVTFAAVALARRRR